MVPKLANPGITTGRRDCERETFDGTREARGVCTDMGAPLDGGRPCGLQRLRQVDLHPCRREDSERLASDYIAERVRPERPHHQRADLQWLHLQWLHLQRLHLQLLHVQRPG